MRLLHMHTNVTCTKRTDESSYVRNTDKFELAFTIPFTFLTRRCTARKDIYYTDPYDRELALEVNKVDVYGVDCKLRSV